MTLSKNEEYNRDISLPMRNIALELNVGSHDPVVDLSDILQIHASKSLLEASNALAIINQLIDHRPPKKCLLASLDKTLNNQKGDSNHALSGHFQHHAVILEYSRD